MTCPPIFKGPIAAGVTRYIGLPIRCGTAGAYISWPDATSNATIVFEVTSFDARDAPLDTAGSYQWKDSGVSITGPSATAAGAAMLNAENVRQRRGRLRITAIADSEFEIYDGGGGA